MADETASTNTTEQKGKKVKPTATDKQRATFAEHNATEPKTKDGTRNTEVVVETHHSSPENFCECDDCQAVVATL